MTLICPSTDLADFHHIQLRLQPSQRAVVMATGYLGNRAPLIRVGVVYAHQEYGHHSALIARTVKRTNHDQICRVGHRSVREVVLLDLQPMSLPWFIQTLRKKSEKDNSIKTLNLIEAYST